MKLLTLREPQLPMIEFMRETKRCCLWAGMGMGKSSATLFLLVLLKMLGEIVDGPILVIGPARVAKDTWPDEVAKWNQFRDMRICALTGEPGDRLTKLLRKADIFTISYELLPWLIEQHLEKWPFRTVVADEADRLKGFRTRKGGSRAHALARVAHNLTDRWINLTGTPSPNGLKDLWGQLWYIDRGARLGVTHTAFMKRWFRPKWSGEGVEPMPHSDREIHEILKDVCLTIDARDYFDLHEPRVVPVGIKLPPAARKLYKALEKDMYAEFEHGGSIEVFNAAALTNKCLQLANGAVYTTPPEWQEVHAEKIDALRSVVAEAGGMPLLVQYCFRSDAARIKRAFPKAADLSNENGMAAFKSGNAEVGYAHPQSVGHGINDLEKVTCKLARFGRTWNLGAEMQFMERIGPMRQFQSGFDRVVDDYQIFAEDTLDEDVIEAHANKRSVQDALLNAMKRR